jgi:hypothetical protein
MSKPQFASFKRFGKRFLKSFRRMSGLKYSLRAKGPSGGASRKARSSVPLTNERALQINPSSGAASFRLAEYCFQKGAYLTNCDLHGRNGKEAIAKELPKEVFLRWPALSRKGT